MWLIVLCIWMPVVLWVVVWFLKFFKWGGLFSAICGMVSFMFGIYSLIKAVIFFGKVYCLKNVIVNDEMVSAIKSFDEWDILCFLFIFVFWKLSDELAKKYNAKQEKEKEHYEKNE